MKCVLDAYNWMQSWPKSIHQNITHFTIINTEQNYELFTELKLLNRNMYAVIVFVGLTTSKQIVLTF